MADDDKGLSSGDSASGVVATVILVFISIALYNVVELNFVIFGTFKKRSGLYFWSFLVATWGVAPNAIGYLLKHLALTDISTLYVTLIVVGWCTMVTGQSVVLYSRLHIVSRSPTRLRLVLAMIIFNAIVLHIPIIVLVYGANSGNPDPFVSPYSIYEKLQLTLFFTQETIISGLYIWETTHLLKVERDMRGRAGTKRVMNHLIYVNVIVILLDVTILALEFANYYDLQTGYKPLVYSVKLKMEFSILNRLVELVQGPAYGSSYARSRTHAAAGVALDTFDGGRHSRFKKDNPEEEVGYKAHISGGDDRELERSATAVVRTTEIIVQSDRPRQGRDRDLESLDGKSGTTAGPAAGEEGPASSASSEIQFASAGA